MENKGYAEAIKEIAKLAVAGESVDRYSAPDGKEYLITRGKDGVPNVVEVEVEKAFYPETMRLNTLTAFASYIRAAIANGEVRQRLYINVESPTKLYATTEVNKFGKRSLIAVAERYRFNTFNFSCNFDFESFVVALRSQFIRTEGLQDLLECLKAVTSENSVTSEDNGITQTVTAKSGVSLTSVNITPVWELKPHRTFTEVEQPSSLFLFRVNKDRESTRYALHETDGNAWAVEAMTNVRTWIETALWDEISAGKVIVL